MKTMLKKNSAGSGGTGSMGSHRVRHIDDHELAVVVLGDLSSGITDAASIFSFI
jgi:UDP-glucose 4-epimerase